MTVRTLMFAALVAAPLALQAQQQAQQQVSGTSQAQVSAAPKLLTGPTAQAARYLMSIDTVVSRRPPGPNQLITAQQTLHDVARLCDLVENDGTLFVACDSTQPEWNASGRIVTATGWETMTRRVSDADASVFGKRRPVVTLLDGVTMAEASLSGIVTLRTK